MNLRVPLLPQWFRWSIVIILASFIFYVSIVTVPPETVVDKAKPGLVPLDKWRHFVAYAALGYALAYATTDWELPTLPLAGFVIGTTMLYGIGIEYGQAFLPQRYFSIGDAYANAIGGVLLIPWYILRPYIDFISLTSFGESLAERI